MKIKLKFKQEKLKNEFQKSKVFTSDNGLLIVCGLEKGMLKVEISHKKRMPTYWEIIEVRFELFSDVKHMVEYYPDDRKLINYKKNSRVLWEMGA